ncbi:hypothetical protein [Microcystis aeruginosa]|uniref:hypothetical protein n=1 Tax=Microcystis aeruginosa TaxID=1126 RepID=UPI0013145577|nr:hypothetical protein [Microcystis aeruginosa]
MAYTNEGFDNAQGRFGCLMLGQFTLTVTTSDRNYPDRDNLWSQWFQSTFSLLSI